MVCRKAYELSRRRHENKKRQHRKKKKEREMMIKANENFWGKENRDGGLNGRQRRDGATAKIFKSIKKVEISSNVF